MSAKTPVLARTMVTRCLSGERREVVLGDLEEGFAATLSSGKSLRAAKWWYRRLAIASVVAVMMDGIAQWISRRGQNQFTVHKSRGDSLVLRLLQDLRIAVRSLAKTPGFTAVVLLTLTLGVGATTAIFSVVHGVLILSPPWPGSERMVYSPRRQEGTGTLQYYWSHLNYRDVRSRVTSFDLYEGVRLGSAIVTGRDRAERFFVRYVTPQFLDMYSARPQLGRMIGAQDDVVPGGHAAVLITHKIWQSYFGADPDVVGTSVNLSGMPYTVIGVMNPEFSYPFGQDVGSEVDLWVPAMMAGEAHARGTALFAERDARAFSIIGRIKEGVTIEQAQAEVDLIAAQLAEEHPESNSGYGIFLRNWALSKTARVRGPLVILMTGAAVLLLLGCFNAANLMLVRGASRQRELAIRMALGAGRRALIRYLTVEAFVLAAIGGGLGILTAVLALPVWLNVVGGMLRVVATQIPPESQVSINGMVLLAAVGATTLAGLIFGVLPAFRVSAVDLRAPLSAARQPGTGRNGSRLHGGLVVLEIATATVLLAASGLLIRGMQDIRGIDLGFTTDRLLTMRMSLPSTKYGSDAELVRVTETLRQRIAAQPGVEWATPWGGGIPGVSALTETTVPEGDVVQEMGDAPNARAHRIGAGALAGFDIALLQGREFTALDRDDTQPVAVVSATLAEKLWPSEDPIGRRFHHFIPPDTDRQDVTVWSVVGVAADASMAGVMPVLGGVERPDDVYFPVAQRPMQELYFMVRTTGEPSLALVQDAIRAVDPEIPLYEVATMEEHLARQEGPTRFATLLMGAFAAAALFLAALGVYGVLAFTVTQRTREIGLRSALGADSADTLRYFLLRGAKLAAVGVLLGCAGALGMGKVLASLVVGTSSMDPLALAAAAALLTGVALLACFLPALRATRIAPVEALRE